MLPASQSPSRWCTPAALLVALLASATMLTTVSARVSAQTPPSIETRIVVRALANDAKLIGDGVGGARVRIRHGESGALLAEGVTRGGTGDTGLIMGPRERAATVFDTPGAAAFATSLAIREPTPIEVEVEAPLGTPHALQRASTSLVLLPGVHLKGEGLVVPLHGFTLRLVEPLAELAVGTEVTLELHAEMLCGCPLTPGGLWDSDSIEFDVALVADDGRRGATGSLTFAGEPSRFTLSLTVPEQLPGQNWNLRVTAADAGRLNTGVAVYPVTLVR